MPATQALRSARFTASSFVAAKCAAVGASLLAMGRAAAPQNYTVRTAYNCWPKPELSQYTSKLFRSECHVLACRLPEAVS